MDPRLKLAAALVATLAIGAAPTFARDVAVYSSGTPASYYYVPAERTYYYVPGERTYYYAPDPTAHSPQLSPYAEQPVVTTRVYEARRSEAEAPSPGTNRPGPADEGEVRSELRARFGGSR